MAKKSGLFASLNLDFLDKPENVLRRKLDHNPTYPFREVEPGLFMFQARHSSFILGVVLCVITALITCVLYGTSGHVDEWIVVSIPVFLGFLQMGIYNRHRRTFVLCSRTKMYEFYKGDELACRGHYHNVYIRLKGEKSGNGKIYFSVVLDGFQMDEESISGSTVHMKKLAKLGRRLAHRLDLNYFDHVDKSRHHVIRHRCPYTAPGSSQKDMA